MRHATIGSTLWLATLVPPLLWSCASTTPQGQPPDMSVAEHEAMAGAEQTRAETHAGRYDPNARATTKSCADLLGSPACWSSTSNPTRVHLEHTENHRRRAAEHRAASRALRDAEERACAQISARDRDESPFHHREDLATVSALKLNEPGAAGYGIDVVERERLAGATVTFRAVPGMTAQWLQRIVDCHLARNAALGHDVPEMPYCPLVPRNVTARVTPTASGFDVVVRSDDLDTAREVLRRAQELVTR